MYSVRVKCICCNSLESFGECPLCDNERYFVYIQIGEIEDYMIDFYSETFLDSTFLALNDEEKALQLNSELENYFGADLASQSPTASTSA